jgi:hypothetical protein
MSLEIEDRHEILALYEGPVHKNCPGLVLERHRYLGDTAHVELGMGSVRSPLGDAASKAVYNTHRDALPAIQRSLDFRILELLVGYVVTRRIGCGHRRHARFRPSTISQSQQPIEAISFT